MLYSVSPNCVACDVPEGVAILDLATNLYFGLDEVGTEIWKRLQQPASLDDLVVAIAADFDVAHDRCTQDVAGFLESMVRHGLVQGR